MADQEAEDQLNALARDLLEEIVAARADELQLANVNVRPFRRVENGREQLVRGHTELRKDGLGHIPEADWKKGQAEYIAKGEAAWKARQEAAEKLFEDIRSTRDSLPDTGPADLSGNVHPSTAAHLELGEAQRHLSDAKDGDSSSLSQAYQHLHQAHQGLSDLLEDDSATTRSQSRNSLDRIQQHMEALDKMAGTNPKGTKKLLGSPDDQQMEAATRRSDVLDRVQKRLAKPQPPVPVPPLPEHKKGAAAVHPQLGNRQVTQHRGDTISGHTYKNTPKPAPVQAPQAMFKEPTPEERQLEGAQHVMNWHAKQVATAKRDAFEQHMREVRDAELQRSGKSVPGQYSPLEDNEFKAHRSNVADAVDEAERGGRVTARSQTLDKYGQVWKPARVALHNEIVQAYVDKSAKVPSGRQAIILGGLPGAGKSTIYRKMPQSKDYVYLSPDDIQEQLAKRGAIPEVAGLSLLEGSSLTHEEASHISNLVIGQLTKLGKNIAFDTTMSDGPLTEDRIKFLKDEGYKVHGVYVHAPAHIALKRSTARYRQGLESYRRGDEGALGGRFIPDWVLRGQQLRGDSKNFGEQTKSARNFVKVARPLLDSEEVWDNSGSSPQRIGKPSPPASHGIASVEELQQHFAAPYVGSTETQARAAEKGTAK